MEEEHPLTRQIRLPEVGELGQARLTATTLEVRGTDGSLTEFLYLHRAGIQRLSIRPGEPASAFTHGGLFRHPSSRRQAAGAWRAIAQIRNILGLDTVRR
ncbi:MAG: hypothetical protein ABJB12_16175 [Pseudomonadota bacterium]